MLSTVLLIFHVIFASLLIILILLQQEQGDPTTAIGGASSTFGMFSGGASKTIFGSKGAGSFMTKLTATTACLFFITNLGLSLFLPNRQDNIAPLFVNTDSPASETTEQ